MPRSILRNKQRELAGVRRRGKPDGHRVCNSDALHVAVIAIDR